MLTIANGVEGAKEMGDIHEAGQTEIPDVRL
jgi:hypothetical protein